MTILSSYTGSIDGTVLTIPSIAIPASTGKLSVVLFHGGRGVGILTAALNSVEMLNPLSLASGLTVSEGRVLFEADVGFPLNGNYDLVITLDGTARQTAVVLVVDGHDRIDNTASFSAGAVNVITSSVDMTSLYPDSFLLNALTYGSGANDATPTGSTLVNSAALSGYQSTTVGEFDAATAGTYPMQWDWSVSKQASQIGYVLGDSANVINIPIISITGGTGTNEDQTSHESGTTYTDQGAVADDVEDGEFPADTGVFTEIDYIGGTFEVPYTAQDLDGYDAVPKSRIVTLTIPADSQYVTLVDPDYLDSANLLFGAVGVPVTDDQLVAPLLTDQGEPFTLLQNGHIEFDNGAPTVSQTIPRYMITNSDGLAGASAVFTYSVLVEDPVMPDDTSYNVVEGEVLVGNSTPATGGPSLTYTLDEVGDYALFNIPDSNYPNTVFIAAPSYPSRQFTFTQRATNASAVSDTQVVTVNILEFIPPPPDPVSAVNVTCRRSDGFYIPDGQTVRVAIYRNFATLDSNSAPLYTNTLQPISGNSGEMEIISPLLGSIGDKILVCATYQTDYAIYEATVIDVG